MNYKAIIKQYEVNQTDIEEKIKSLKKLYSNEEKLWKIFDELDSDFFLNNQTINFFADSLQMVNNPNRITQFELLDIKNIYGLLVHFYPNDIQYRIDLISFIHNVLDDEQEVARLIEETNILMDEKRSYLENIMRSIENNK